MTTSELRNAIAESSYASSFNAITVEFNFSHAEFNLKLSGISAIFEFVDQQLSGWTEYGKLPDELIKSRTYFDTAKRYILTYVEAGLHTPYQADDKKRILLSHISSTNTKPFVFNSPQVLFLISVYKNTPIYFLGAFNVLAKNNYAVNTYDQLHGAIMAYEFILKDHTGITERRNAEKTSITRLRNDFHKYLSESESHLNEHLSNAKGSYSDYVKQLDTLKSEKNTSFTSWFDDVKSERWEKWFTPTQKKISDLEKTYQEKLKLEEPAKYWQERSQTLKKEGWRTLSILIVLVLITCGSLFLILWLAPNIVFASWFNGDISAAVRWTVVYATLISFIAYCIRAISKVMFSSFHLARDCEERHTLTYFYLSLLKDSKVDEKDKQLIMQSLFSRADTGLLKEDSSPTMPNDVVSKFMQK